MALFGTKEKSPLYHAGGGNKWSLPYASIEQLRKWADDPNCIEREECAQILNDKIAAEENRYKETQQRLEVKRSELLQDPFDPRTEISADARHIAGRIVKHLWIIFVLLPVVLGILYAVLK
jgi:hypothetical protein